MRLAHGLAPRPALRSDGNVNTPDNCHWLVYIYYPSHSTFLAEYG